MHHMNTKIKLVPTFLIIFLLVSCSWFKGKPTSFSPPRYDTPRYNIILIVTDDQRFDTLEYMPRVQTLLVEQGMVFTNAFATTPACCPSRSSIFSGLYTHNHGVLQNSLPHGSYAVFDDSNTLSVWLSDAGYRTGLIGKYLNGYNAEANGGYLPPGWNYWVVQKNDDSETNVSGRYYDYSMFDNGVITNFYESSNEYGTDVMAEKAVEFIRDSAGEKPFFLYFSPPAPHYPAIPAPRHVGIYDDIPLWRPESFNRPSTNNGQVMTQDLINESDEFRIAQLNSLLAVDDSVSLIVSTLEDCGELDNTVIVFTSDHGYMWGEHAVARTKTSFYDEALRIPLVVRFPKIDKVPLSSDEFVLLIDLAPTFTEIAGLGVPEDIDGISFLPLIFGDNEDWRDEFIFEYWTGNQPDVTRGIITKDWKFTILRNGDFVLTNRVQDPFELINLAYQDSNSELVNELLTKLELLWEGETK